MARKLEKTQESLDAFVDELHGLERAANTIKNNQLVIGGFLRLIDPKNKMWMHAVTEDHVTTWLRTLTDVSPGTKRAYLGYVKRFLAWCVETERLQRNEAKRLEITRRQSDRQKTRLPAERFAELLDAAGAKHPRNRIGVALGLYTLLRAVDVVDVRVGEMNRGAGTLRKYLQKVQRWHEIGISLDLDEELERWYRWYRKDLGVTRLEDDWPVVPPLHRPGVPGRDVVNAPVRIRQYRKDGSIALLAPESYARDIVQPALRAVGVQMRYTDRRGRDKSANEGAHTLRRSGGRALFDLIVSQGDDKTNALFLIQALYDHSDVRRTADYIGVALQRDTVNAMLRGQRMYGGREDAQVAASGHANVLSLHPPRDR